MWAQVGACRAGPTQGTCLPHVVQCQVLECSVWVSCRCAACCAAGCPCARPCADTKGLRGCWQHQARQAAHDSAVCAATNESLCASATKLIGTTTVFAKPGRGKEMLDMAATMPGARVWQAQPAVSCCLACRAAPAQASSGTTTCSDWCCIICSRSSVLTASAQLGCTLSACQSASQPYK